ncbi:phenylalanine ammonia-lyase [Lindgomyces ingoldianus]|uniref:Phenylalanine ammonia-lyase n=1 Tax=Lindgomyces ingoldianus TaxID=673940 RepID=A0ACB6R2D3_9PLEO|nr:phenylalanine ammonia-lyase [Lindgomyces ingoldianus]KAF2473409.1 phenylalanine ammonia-lyase [Lindgomyces ingoldianus]
MKTDQLNPINGCTVYSHADHSHASLVHQTWARLQSLVEGDQVRISGQSLDIASVVAVARNGCSPELETTPEVLDRIQKSVDTLEEYLSKGYYAYGVNTGFGGSADSRTKDVLALQRSLLQHTQSGILVDIDKKSHGIANLDVGFHSMPASWVKGTMLVRCNSVVRGHSAVSLRVVELIINLLRNNCVPVIPLRGSVSASGDLLPLAYIGGAVEGSPDIFVCIQEGDTYKIISAKEALAHIGETPITLGPKEGLGLINGTAASASVSCLALYDANNLAIMTQVLTAMAVEALLGNAESFHPFIAEVRPHQGQIEVAKNIRGFLQGSKLATCLSSDDKDRTKSGLYQDRYAVRSASQWIGPQLEDLLLAHEQITTELNSTTDNPLIDIEKKDVYSCANFQAASITSATEKTRLAIQMLGKIMFGQCTELINPFLNNGLPANLAADDPSLSFTMKGVDVNMAAYMSELAFLANPVSSHVQSAEMHNQAVNSLALISSRYTMQAVEVARLMASCFLYVCCQALDLRVLHLEFLSKLKPAVLQVTQEVFGELLTPHVLDTAHSRVVDVIPGAWGSSTHLDATERYEHLVNTTLPVLTNAIASTTSSRNPSLTLAHIEAWKERMLETVSSAYTKHRATFFLIQSTPQYLGKASTVMYTFVRKDLGVPMHQGLVEHPRGCEAAEANTMDGRPKKTIGSWVSIIYESLRSGRMNDRIMACLND